MRTEPPDDAHSRYGGRVHGVSGGSGAMFDRIARRYDLLNRVMSLGLDRGWRRELVRALDCGEAPHVLDVASGTADVAVAIAETLPLARIVGVDTSAQMLRIGRDKLAARGLGDRVALLEGDARALPFQNDHFDAAVIAFGIRNVPDREQGLREMVRVTRPGGRVVILELNEPRHGPVASLARFYIHQVVPRVGALLSGAREYRYLEDSIAAFPPADEFERLMDRCGIGNRRVRQLSFGVANLFVGEAD